MAKINNSEDKLKAAKSIADQNRKGRTFYEAIEDIIVRIFRVISTIVDKFFFAQKSLPFFALVLAVLMYFGVTISEENSLIMALSSSKTLNNVAVTVMYNSDQFEVTGAPSTCQVVLTGDGATVTNAASNRGYCLINLKDYSEGTHNVPITAENYGDSVNTVVTPSSAQITIKKKTTDKYTLSYDFVNLNHMDDKYILGTPVFTNGTEINIRASQSTLDSISLVKALIDVKDQTSDFTVEAPLVAYDSRGKVVNAEIVPNTVTVAVPVSSPNKIVPINIKVSGIAPVGYAVESVKMDCQSTTIYASEAVLNEVNEVFVNLDLSTISGDTKLTQSVILPSGVSSSEITSVNLEVTLTEVATKTLEGIKILYRNNDKGYGITSDFTSIDVIVSAAPDILKDITADNIVVYIDVVDLGNGEYTLPLLYETNGTQFATYSLSENEIKIKITE